MTLPATFLSKTRPSDCTIWTGAINSKGYGCYAIAGKSHLAHRVAWEDAHGPIADGMTVDHLCRVRTCVNVDHMEVVTRAENIKRGHELVVGMHCSHGHLIESDTDLYVHRSGNKECDACRVERGQRLVGGSEVRRWARANGYEVSVHGRLPESIWRDWRNAQKSSAA